MRKFRHDYEVLVEGAYLRNAEPQKVYDWLEANRAPSVRWDFAPEHIRRVLLSRSDPLINLGLARFCAHAEILRPVYAAGDLSLKCAVLSNPLFGDVFKSLSGGGSLLKSKFFDSDEDVHEFIHSAELEALEAYFTNASIDANDLESLFNQSGVFEGLNEDRYLQLVTYALKNPRLHKPREVERHDFAAVDPFLNVEHNDAIKAAWNLLQTVPTTEKWASIFGQLWDKMHYAGPPRSPEYTAVVVSGNHSELNRIEAADELRFFHQVLNRWREEGERDRYHAYTRRNVAIAVERALALSPKYQLSRMVGATEMEKANGDRFQQLADLLREHHDLHVRLGYYGSFGPVDVQEIHDAYERDKEAFVEAAIENEYFYRASVPHAIRAALEEHLDKVQYELRVRHGFLRESLEEKDPAMYVADLDEESKEGDQSDKWYRQRSSMAYKLHREIEAVLNVIGDAMDRKRAFQLSNAMRKLLNKIEDLEIEVAKGKTESMESGAKRQQERDTLYRQIGNVLIVLIILYVVFRLVAAMLQ